MIYKKNQHLIFKIAFSGVILGLALAISFIEIPSINLPGAPLEFGICVVLLVLPIIGPWFGILIAGVKPWLHVLAPHHVDHGNIVVEASIGTLAGVVVILVYYGLFWLLDKKLKLKNIAFKIITVSIVSIVTSLFVTINVYAWAADAFGWDIAAGHAHDHVHSDLVDISKYKLSVAVFGIYLPIIFSKYFITLLLTMFLEKPLVNFIDRLHDKYHDYQDQKKVKNKDKNKEENKDKDKDENKTENE